MKILKGLNNKYFQPCNISIGVFDGLHLGHQLILKKLKEKNKTAVIITFINSPSEILNPQNIIKPIYSLKQKLKFLEDLNIDVVVLLEFTKELADLSYIEFLKILKTNFPFEYLIVGEDVSFGKNKFGNQKTIKTLENTYQFKLEIIKKIKYQNKIISSSWIRTLIKEENFNLAEKLLTRPYKETKWQNSLQ